jgi:hypothetical protein
MRAPLGVIFAGALVLIGAGCSQGQRSTIRADGSSDVQPAAPPSTTPEIAPQPESWPQGILELKQAPFSASEYQISNRWQADIAGNHVQAFAGSMGSDPTQGVVVRAITSIVDSRSSTYAAFTAPKGSGSLRVVDAKYPTLILQGDYGQRYTFDVSSGALARAS